MPELEQLTDEELAGIAGVTLKSPGGGVLTMPVSGVVGSGFDDDRAGGRKHRSGDISAPAGTPVVAPGNMRFLYGGQGGTNLRSNDWWAHFEDTETGVQYRMAHVGPVSHLAPGQEFKRGEPVAVVGNAIKGTHLHMSVVDPNGQHVDWLNQAGLQRGHRIEAGGEVKGRGWLAQAEELLGPSAAEAGTGPAGMAVVPSSGRNLEEMDDEQLAKIAGVKLDDLSDEELAKVAGVQLAPRSAPEPVSRDEYMESVQGLDLGAGMAPPEERDPRPPGIYAEGPVTERNLWDTVKNYLGYQDLPAFLPAFNQETGLWQAQNVYEARKLFHGFDDYTELERVLYHGVISPLTLGMADVVAKDRFGPVPAPETIGGAVGSGALSFGSFMVQPFNLAEGLLGSRLAPTRTGLRGLAQLMAQGGASLGLASSLSSLLPSLAHNDRLTEAGLDFVKGTASGAVIGALFPVAGVIPTKALRMAVGLGALDMVKTRFQAAPDQGWFTIDDVYRGVMDGSIDRKVLAQKTMEYLMDLYFLGKTPSMKKQLMGLKTIALMEEAGKVSPQEAEDALVEIGKSGVLKEQGSGVRGQGPGGKADEIVQAGKPKPVEEAAPWRKPWELSEEEYEARSRALRGEGQPEPTAAKLAKLREADVRHALKRGETVPPEVLADFPELAGRLGRELPAAETPGKEQERDPYQEALDKQQELLQAVEGKLGRARSDKSKEKLTNQKSDIQTEIKRLEEAKSVDAANQENIRQEVAEKQKVPEAPDYAFIEPGDLIFDAKSMRAGGVVLREAVQGKGKAASKGFIVDMDGQEAFIGRDEAQFMGMEEQEQFLGPEAGGRGPGPKEKEGVETRSMQKMYSGGPGVEEIQEYGRQLEKFGKRLIDWIDVRLEKNLPPDLQDKDASKVIGSLLLKFQQFEDIARTYPEAKPTFDAARAGLALKTRHAAEFYSLTTPYLSRLNPEARGRVDKVLVDLDIINDPAMGLEFRIGNDIDRWQSYLLNPREDIREKGIAFYMSRGLNPVEAAGAFGVRMALDYAKALHLDWHTRTFQEWLESHGFDRGKVKDILDWTLNTEMAPEEIAKAFFGPDPGKNVPATLERFRNSMNYWLKETNQYIPHSRYGEYFLRVIDTNQAAAAKEAYRTKLKAIDRRYPKDQVDVEATLKQHSLEFMEDAGEGEAPQAVKPGPLTKADRLRAEARAEYQDALKATVIHATAAETRAQYHEKRAALEAEFPGDQGFKITETLNKQLPMEVFSETHIPRVWTIVSEAANKGTMPHGAKEAMIEAWQDFLAAKGFGAHFIKRSNVPGYETDLTRPLTGYLSGLAGYIGKMEKIRGFSETFPEVAKQKMPVLLKHLNEYANYLLSNPKEYEGIRNVIYNWTLGGNISFHLINSLQNLSTGWAVLGTAGPAPLKQLTGSYLDWTRFMATGEGLRPGEEAMLHRARLEPELAPSGVGELSGQAYNPLYRWMHNDPTSLSAKAMDVFKGFWSGAFVEQLNRETFWLAAYRATGDYDQTLELVRQAHFLYGKETRPSVGRGAGSLPMIFMTYTSNYLTLYKNFSKAALGYNPEVYGTKIEGVQGLTRMLAGAFVTGGLMATGAGAVIKKTWQMVFGSNLEEDAKDYFQETFGVSRGKAEFAERFLDRGLPAAALGVDIGSRIAPNLPMMNLPPGTVTPGSLLQGALGAGSIPLQVGFGIVNALGRGERGRALEAAAPVSVRNILAAYRLKTEGATTMKGQPIFTAQGEPLVLDIGETARKALGFQPIRLAEHYSKAGHARKMEEDRRDTAQGFAGDLARAIKREDEDGFNRTIDAWVAYNNKMIEAGRYADVIEPRSVEQAVKSRFKPQYPDVSQKKMMLRDMGRPSLAETLSPEEMEQ